MKSDKIIYTTGAVAAALVLTGSLLDIAVSMMLGGDLTALPATAAGRFEQISATPFIGIYMLDFLNLLTALIMVPCTLALCYAHRDSFPAAATLAFAVALIGTAVFVSGNPALPMLELSRKYSAAAPDHKALLAAAGEAILARGEHGSLGVFPGFILSTLANIIVASLMLRGKIFSALSSWFGIIGNASLFVYLALVTFAPQTRTAVTALAAPGGILAILWLALCVKGLLFRARQTARTAIN